MTRIDSTISQYINKITSLLPEHHEKTLDDCAINIPGNKNGLTCPFRNDPR